MLIMMYVIQMSRGLNVAEFQQKVCTFIYLKMHSNTLTFTTLEIGKQQQQQQNSFKFKNKKKEGRKCFILRLYGVRHMVKDHSDSERGNPLPPHGLLFPINSKGSFICTIPQIGYHIPRPRE